MDYQIKACDETFLIDHAREFAALCRESFAEHAARDVRMGPCYMTPELWIKHAKGSIGLYIEIEGRIVAFWLASADFDRKTSYGKILAIDPKHKGRHMGSALSIHLSNYLREKGIDVFMTDTSLNAPHVVKFHKSYGCKAVGMISWPNTNYYTVLLRLALRPDSEISDSKANIMYLGSSIICKLIYNEDGSHTHIGKFARFFKAMLKGGH